MSVMVNLSNRTEAANAILTYIDDSNSRFVKTTDMMRDLGIERDSANVNRRKVLALLDDMHRAGLLQRAGQGSYSWSLTDHLYRAGWNTTDPFKTECPKPEVTETAAGRHRGPFGPGRVRIIDGNAGKVYDCKDELKRIVGEDFKWDNDLKVWHVSNSPDTRTRLSAAYLFTKEKVAFHTSDPWDGVFAPKETTRVSPPAETNGHAQIVPMTVELSNQLKRLENDIKREEDRSAKLAIDLKEVTKAFATVTDVCGKLSQRLEAAEKELAAKPKTLKIEKYDGTVKVLKDVALPSYFDEAVSLVKCREPILLVGPAGCGKSTVAKLLADVNGLEFSKTGGNESITAAHLLGRDRPLANKGEGRYEVSEFVTAYEKGGLHCLDELDACDPNVMLSLNAALDDTGFLPLPNRAKAAKRHKDFVCVATANTFGRGANRVYCGRNQLDEATLDRFRIGIIECYYDEAIEVAVCPDKELREMLQAIRRKAEDANIRRVISTRYLAKAYKMMTKGGWEQEKTVKKLLAGWNKDEMAKVGL